MATLLDSVVSTFALATVCKVDCLAGHPRLTTLCHNLYCTQTLTTSSILRHVIQTAEVAKLGAFCQIGKTLYFPHAGSSEVLIEDPLAVDGYSETAMNAVMHGYHPVTSAFKGEVVRHQLHRLQVRLQSILSLSHHICTHAVKTQSPLFLVST